MFQFLLKNKKKGYNIIKKKTNFFSIIIIDFNVLGAITLELLVFFFTFFLNYNLNFKQIVIIQKFIIYIGT